MNAYTTTDRSKAKAIAKKLDSTTYYLGHGEYSRPDYKVRKVRGEGKYEIYAKYQYYAGTYNRKQNGPICTETAYHA